MNEQVHLFNNTILNIFKNFVPNEIATFDDSYPPWISEQIKTLITLRNDLFNLYLQNRKNQNDYMLLQKANHQLSELINGNKKK